MTTKQNTLQLADALPVVADNDCSPLDIASARSMLFSALLNAEPAILDKLQAMEWRDRHVRSVNFVTYHETQGSVIFGSYAAARDAVLSVPGYILANMSIVLESGDRNVDTRILVNTQRQALYVVTWEFNRVMFGVCGTDLDVLAMELLEDLAPRFGLDLDVTEKVITRLIMPA